MSRKQIADYLATGYWESTGKKARKFDVMAGDTLTANITALTPEGQELAKGAMAVWSTVSGINFELSTSPDAHIIFDDEEPGAFAYSTVTDDGTIITQSFVNVSTEWLYGYGSQFDSFTYSTYIHEVGHALGLGHPGPYNGKFPNLFFETISPYDSWQVSVMSYIPQTVSILDLTPGSVETSYAHPVTPMIADVEAIHQLYGEPEGINSGNTIYGRGANMGGQEEKFYRAWSGEGNPFFNVRFAGQTAPTFYDNDGDGDLDMSTLSLDRTVAYDYKNVGTAANPKYELELSVKFNVRIIDYEVADFDADGDMDLMIAYRDGILFFYVENGEIVETIEVETYPLYDDYDMELVDIDADGDLDIVEIDSTGSYLHINIGTKYAAEFDFDNVLHWPQDLSWIKTYEFADADNDGDYDVVITDYYGGLYFWENIGNKRQYNFESDIIYNGNPLDAALYYERLPEGILNDFAFVDLDNDGDKDFFALDTYGGVFYFENQGTFREIDYEPTSFHRNITFTLTDTDGYDTLDVRTDISAQQIDMNPGGVSSVYGLIGNVVIGENTVVERVYTGSGNDFVEGNSAGNRIYLNDGHDAARGNEGNDVIDGGRGHDVLSGGPGHDWIYGRSGNDTMHGGFGNDTFVFAPDGGTVDSILDFGNGRDRLHLAAFETIEAFEDITVFRSGTDTLVDLTDHGGGQIQLIDYTDSLTANDFYLG